MCESKMTITKKKTKIWRDNNHLQHREDGPAVELKNGTKFWYIRNVIHRTDGPAIEWANGSKEWRLNGQLHRVDGPAIEFFDGGCLWFYKNKRIGDDLEGFWALWNLLNEEERQNVNLHKWLVRLMNV